MTVGEVDLGDIGAGVQQLGSETTEYAKVEWDD